MRRLLALVVLAAACSADPAALDAPTAATALPVPANAQEAVVARHTDGDTFWLRGVGAGPVPRTVTKVRLLEVDTPEVFGVAGCFGAEASRRTAELLPLGAHVRVQSDRQPRDRYGRLLLYVWTSAGVSLEEELLRGGYARTLLVRPNARHIELFRADESAARSAGRGLWGSCHS